MGRAFVVNDWYITAYEPILDAKKQLIGALYFGVKQEDVPELRKGITDIVVGKTGYVFALGASGEQKGRYLISLKGQRDGENIWEAKDAEGNLFIQSMIEKALATKGGKCDFERYSWRNKDETEAAVEDRCGHLFRALGLGDRRGGLRRRFPRCPGQG